MKLSVIKTNSASRPEHGRRDALRAAAMLAGSGVLGTFGAVSPAHAAGYPDKPIHLIHAFAPGSGTDTAGRIIAERLSQRLGQPVVVDNRPGANGIIGGEYAARTPPDGYTMMMVYVDNFAVNPSLYKRLGYHPLKDFDALTLIGKLPLVLMGAPNLAPTSMTELLAASRTRKDPFSLGTWGIGSTAHMLGEMLRLEARMNLTYVPFQGATPATNALFGGHVDLGFNNPVVAAELLRTGKARIYAVGGDQRWPTIPDVPTFRELGLKDVSAATWHGLVVRAGGKKDIIDKLYTGIAAVMNEPDTRAKLLAVGYDGIDGRPPAQFSRFLADEMERWGRVVKASGAQIDR
ncbi:Bug family tripartite tricarboxylate transporter substrate binding protein [Caenimonas soli]|uniref:Bug family tripartite tricarboxylate transporter substrate binding protein n=1 Tax=Caenimonas soli TaxID=2735555 RepID=UPI001557CCEB|nr:tripartite tricarboxylate transporter substrate binding protein [Caenimonas soli]NPC58309.1 tripartite tricarboxylate transporter substrate binding protein [Caenimonas soli]